MLHNLTLRKEDKPVKRLTLVLGCCLCFALSLYAARSGDAGKSDPGLAKADQIFAQDLEQANTSELATLLDDEFTWTDSAGKTRDKQQMLADLKKDGAMADTDTLKQQVYGDVGVVTASAGRLHTLRVWVKRGGQWRLLVYHDATLVAKAHPPSSSGLTDCENPCKTVPYQPRNADEQGVISSWQALETAVTNHDSQAWASHMADEFTLTNSNNDHVMTKADRIAILDKQKQSGAGSAPSPLVSAKMYDFPDAIVMTAQHQSGDHKPTHVTRVWIKRDRLWQMAISQQTTIE
jgi:hypothetical protein